MVHITSTAFLLLCKHLWGRQERCAALPSEALGQAGLDTLKG